MDGSVIHFTQAFKALKKEGWKTLILAPEPSSKPPNYPLDIIYVDAPPSKSTAMSMMRRLEAYQRHLVAELRSGLVKFKLDIIYVRQGLLNIAPVLASALKDIPMMLEVNGDIAKELKIAGFSKAITGMFKLQAKMVYSRPSSIITVSEHVSTMLQENYGVEASRITVIPNGVDIDLFKPKSSDPELRERYSIPANAPVLLFTGYLVGWQGIDSNIALMPELLKHHPDLRFLIVGQGPVRESLEAQARELRVSESVIFTGPVPHTQVPKFIGISDICLSVKPPLLPGSPLKIREYMACGRPVIASCGTGYDFDMVETAKAGLLVDPSDNTQTIAAILKLLGDPSIREEMGGNGSRYAREHCSWASAAIATNSVAQDVLGWNGDDDKDSDRKDNAGVSQG